MEEKNKAKTVIIIGVALLFIFVGVIVFGIKNDKHSYASIKELNNKLSKYDNYRVTITSNLYNEKQEKLTSKKEVKRNEDIKRIVYFKEDGSVDNTRWTTKDKLIVEETKSIKENSFIDNDLDILSQYIENKDEYKYLRDEIYNNNKCIVCEFLRKSSEKSVLWIDIEKNTVLKEEQYDKNGKLVQENFYDIELNCIQNNELQLPDITEYTYIKE